MPNKWYQLRAKAQLASAVAAALGSETPDLEILIYGDIGESWWEESITASELVRELADYPNAKLISVRINSFGGSVPDGLAIYNALRRHGARIVTCNDGVAMSIASLIFLAGDERIAAANSLTMIHAPWCWAAGNSAQLREQADALDKFAAAMAANYVEASGKPLAEVLALLTDGKDHYYTAEESLSEGWASSVDATLNAAAVVEDPAPPPADPAAPAIEPGAYHRGAAACMPAFVARAMAAGRQLFGAAGSVPHDPRFVFPAAAAANTQETHMPNPVLDAAGNKPADPAQPDESAIRAKALAEDKARRDAVKAALKPFESNPEINAAVMARIDEPGYTADEAGRQILAALASKAEPLAGHHVTVEDVGRNRLHADVVDALMVRAGVASAEVKNRVRAQRNQFQSDSLLDIARASLERGGVNYRGMDKMAIVAASFTQGTSDFPILLENVLHKTLQAAYAIAPDTWRRFARQGSVSDFRDAPRYRVGSFGVLDTLTELGELKNKTIPDGEKASIRAGTKGNLINISRQVVVNDDLGAFIGLADQLGRAAARSIETDVFALLALNSGLGPVMLDGYTLFHASHGNITTGAAISVAGLDADRVAMASQKDVSGNDYLDLRPSVLLIGTALGGTARVINSSQYDPDTANKLQRGNMVYNLFSDIVDTPRLTGTRRYLFADPQVAPVLEVAFLDGNDLPRIEAEAGFDVDGTRQRVLFDYGVGATDFRGAITNAGA